MTTQTHNFIRNKLKERQTALNGTIYRIRDAIATIVGLDDVKAGELLYFPKDESYRIAFNLERHGVRAILFSDGSKLQERDQVESTGRLADIEVTNSFLGAIVDRFGKLLLPNSQPERSQLSCFKGDDIVRKQPFESPAPAIMSRTPVNKSLQTGSLAVDSLIPIRRRQRELLIRDRQIGKTQIALDTILNLSNKYDSEPGSKPVVCVYVAIGQKASNVAEIQKKLRSAMKQTIIVSATAASTASMQFLAPFTGAAIAETFMAKRYDTLIIYDDLTRHAQAYREMSLLLRRPPGREAYPRDIFYVHARLLERAANVKDRRSMTALPVIETQAGDISAYIPTNVISITDGQVFFSRELFNRRFRPAIDVRLSVSRVGSAAQSKAISKLAGKLKLILAQYRELQIFTQFASDIDSETQKQLDDGSRLTNIFIQPPAQPYLEYVEYALLYAYNKRIDNSLDLLPLLKDQKSKTFIESYQKNEPLETIQKNLDTLIEQIQA